MSRSGYTEDGDDWSLIRWRGAVASAIRGKRGQAFLREMLTALDALPQKRLIVEELQFGEEVCALGAVGKARAIEMGAIDPEDFDTVAATFQIAPALAREIMHINDDQGFCGRTPEQCFNAVRAWVVGQIRP